MTSFAVLTSEGSERYGKSWTMASTSYAPLAASARKQAPYAVVASAAPHGSSGLPT